jgi:hypothetical protein
LYAATLPTRSFANAGFRLPMGEELLQFRMLRRLNGGQKYQNKKMLHYFQCKSILTLLLSIQLPQNPRRKKWDFVRKTALFRPKSTLFDPKKRHA